jgi:hypothetical protein
VTSRHHEQAAKLWQLMYPTKNFYGLKSDDQRKWIRFAKDAESYFLKDIGEQNATRYF